MADVIDMKVWQLRRARPGCFTAEQWAKVIDEASRPEEELFQEEMARSLFGDMEFKIVRISK